MIACSFTDLPTDTFPLDLGLMGRRSLEMFGEGFLLSQKINFSFKRALHHIITMMVKNPAKSL